MRRRESSKKPATKRKMLDQNDRVAVIRPNYRSSGKLAGKVAIVTGGDSGIGRSVAVHFAREGASVAIVYHQSDEDAMETKKMVENEKQQCLVFKGDIAGESFCRRVVRNTYKKFGKLSVLVNNAGMHEPDEDFMKISSAQFRRTFQVNMFSFFFFTHEALPLLDKDGCIINTASVVAYRGSEHLVDYASTNGAIVSFTRSLAKNLAKQGIRVNGVAPGPIWTPLVIESFDKKHLDEFGQQTPMGRAGYPYEVAPAFVFLASEDASYITGQLIHVNGGEVVGG
jgi:NAD(P)-dependent dehydrogenase (short-subunit alcohol dehydrogenase family)